MDNRPKNFSKPSSKLTPDRVRVIRRGCERGIPAVYFAKQYGMSAESIRKVARYETWGWVSDEEGISMTPSENVREWPEQVEDRMLQKVPEMSKEEEARSWAKVQEKLSKPADDPWKGYTAAMFDRAVGYGNITREEADRILTERAKS